MIFKNQKKLKIFIFLLGFISGICAFGLLNVNTYSCLLDTLRLDFRANQHLLAIKATQKNDIVNMVVHRQNVVNSFSKNAFSIFDRTSTEYNFWLPFKLFVLQKITNSTNNLEEGTLLAEALERGKLAYSLEKIGLTEKANTEWDIAYKLAGYIDKQEEFKQLVKHLIDNELSTPLYQSAKLAK